MKVEIKGFTEDQNKSMQSFVDSLSGDIADQVKDILANNADLKYKELKELIESSTKDSVTAEELKNLKDQFKKLETELPKMVKTKMSENEVKTFDQAVRDLINSDEFKKAKAAKFRDVNTFEVKASTANITGTVNMTVQSLDVDFDPLRALAFMPRVRTIPVGADKNEVLWVEGTYTSNVGYVTEGTGQSTADSGTATEKTRKMAKISAKLTLTSELLEDADYIASSFKMEMQENALLFVDGEMWSGDGDDSTNPKHIYGIQGQSTAFDSTYVTSAGAEVESANIRDLVDACLLQCEAEEHRGANTCWINPKDFFKYKTAKDANGNYLFERGNGGGYTVSGLAVVPTNAITAGTMEVGDSSKIRYYVKRNPELKISQMNSSDFVNDQYTAVMFVRSQVVVKTPDKKALIYVSDIDASITAISK